MKPDFFFCFPFIFAPGVRAGWEEGHAKSHSLWRSRVHCSSSFGDQNCKRACDTLKHDMEPQSCGRCHLNPPVICPGILGEIWGCFSPAVGLCLAFTSLGCSQGPESWIGSEDGKKEQRNVSSLGFQIDGASLVSWGRYSFSLRF